MATAYAVITVKRFDRAKQRLAQAVDPEVREHLAEAMFTDVLEAVGAARMLAGITSMIDVIGAPPDAIREAIGRPPG